MARLTLDLAIRRRWFFYPVLVAGAIALHLGLLRDKPSAEYIDGMQPARDRLAQWLVDHAMRVEVGPPANS